MTNILESPVQLMVEKEKPIKPKKTKRPDLDNIEILPGTELKNKSVKNCETKRKKPVLRCLRREIGLLSNCAMCEVTNSNIFTECKVKFK